MTNTDTSSSSPVWCTILLLLVFSVVFWTWTWTVWNALEADPRRPTSCTKRLETPASSNFGGFSTFLVFSTSHLQPHCLIQLWWRRRQSWASERSRREPRWRTAGLLEPNRPLRGAAGLFGFPQEASGVSHYLNPQRSSSLCKKASPMSGQTYRERQRLGPSYPLWLNMGIGLYFPEMFAEVWWRRNEMISKSSSQALSSRMQTLLISNQTDYLSIEDVNPL